MLRPGPFSLSLSVADLAASRAFYEALGFAPSLPAGEGGPWETYGQTWLMLSADNVVLGLFQGALDQNTFTFNPADLRGLVAQAKAGGVAFLVEPEGEAGAGQALALDPDGNAILLDQLEA